RRECEGRTAPTGKGGADLADTVHQLGIGAQSREADTAHFNAAGVDDAVERGSIVGEDDDSVGAAGSDREGSGENGAVADEMRFDLLRIAHRSKVERSAERAVGQRQPPGEPARIGAKVS